MKELQIIELTINKALEKGVFTNCKDISDVLQAITIIAQKLNDQENGNDHADN